MAQTTERCGTCFERIGARGPAGPDTTRTILGGFIGTIAITLMMYFVAPVMTGAKMDIAAMLGSVLGGSWSAGLVMHLANGTLIFPLIYAFLLYAILPGGPAVKGTTWGAILWLLAQVVVMPLMGAGFFSANTGGILAAAGSLMGHLVYGTLLGVIAGAARGPRL
ncbi:MAG: hypothetical protein HYS12_05060 [Planctomycetes bacterium]|nr:hypothetical protein [Planctomycetota bacterium]